jgi:hypothetical protein
VRLPGHGLKQFLAQYSRVVPKRSRNTIKLDHVEAALPALNVGDVRLRLAEFLRQFALADTGGFAGLTKESQQCIVLSGLHRPNSFPAHLPSLRRMLPVSYRHLSYNVAYEGFATPLGYGFVGTCLLGRYS